MVGLNYYLHKKISEDMRKINKVNIEKVNIEKDNKKNIKVNNISRNTSIDNFFKFNWHWII
jgi:hypothetical protein